VKKTIAAGLIALVCADAAVGATAPTETRLEQSSEQLARVRARIAELSRAIEEDRARRNDLQGQLETAERAVAQARDGLQSAVAKAERQAAKVRDTEAQRDAAQRRLDAEKAALAAQLRAAYIVGSGGTTELALSQSDPGRVARMSGYYDYLDRARAQRIHVIDVELHRVAQFQQQVLDEQKSLQQLQDQRRDAYNQLQQRRSERAQALAALQQRLGDENEELQQLQANERQIEALLESLKKAMASAPPVVPAGPVLPFPKMRGRLMWPLRGKLLADYGDPKAGGRLQWKGLWISADDGAPVRACARGRVAYVGWMSRYGLIVVVEHEDGYFSLYGHNSTVQVAAGDAVNAGEVLANAGSTGGYEQPGLYFEIRKGTDPVNPHEWLSR
jgi:septal ring factor EnvC (AmiA/AmiB activator)